VTTLIVLGSSNAVASEDHENTHMVIVGNSNAVMIDCVSSPLLRLGKAGVDYELVSDIILTHFHPDHVSGIPLMLMDMWLLGRRAPLRVLGLKPTIERAQALMDLFGWRAWPNFYPVTFEEVPAAENVVPVEYADFRVLSAPVHHLIPTIGLRIESIGSGRAAAYSCDTEPCAEVIRLATGADVLIHEAAGAGRGHSSAEQAGDIARQAEVGGLLLIHYPTNPAEPTKLLAEAARTFHGEISLAVDYQRISLD